jgi:CHAT domain-containing protein/Tfp pilus assembly protein PilF
MKKLLLLTLILSAHCFELLAQKTTNIDDLILDARYDEALQLIDTDLAKQSSPAQTLLLENKKAETLIRRGRFDDAEKILSSCQQRSAQLNDRFITAITQSNLGFLRLNQGRNDLAEEALKQSLSEFDQAGKAEGLENAQALANLGLVYMSSGKYSQAEEQLQMALSIRQSKVKGTSELIAATYNDLGLVYSQINKDKALDFYEKAMTIYKQLHGAEHNKIAITNINTGIIYRDLELYGDAVNNFEAALKIWEKIYPNKPTPTKAIALYNLGQTYLKMGDRKAASGYYSRARKMYEESYGTKHPEVASVLNAIGNLQIAEGQFDMALQTYQDALKANVPSFSSSDISVNPRLTDYYHGTRLLYTLMFKAEAFEARYLQKTLKFNDLRQAIATLQLCDSLIDILRQQTTNESDKIQLGAVASEVYADGVRITHEAGVNAVKKDLYFEKSFYFAEKSKGAALLDAIADTNAKSFAGIPKDLLEEEHALKSAIALTSQKLAQKPTADEERYLRETSFSLKRSYDEFTKRLEKQFPDYFNLKFNPSSPSIGQIQNLLENKKAIISYFIDDKNSRIYIFQITRKSFSIEEHALPAEFDKYITGLRNGIFYSEIKSYSTSAEKLYDLLIPKISSKISELVILPTGRLGIIPFEALLTREEKTTDYKSLPYLIRKFDISYEFSAGLILQKSTKKSNGSTPSIFLFAPVTFPVKDKLDDLPGTEKEVKDIAQIFQSKNYTCDSFLKEKADEQLLKSDKLLNYNLLHLATHGVVDENNPELSRVFLQSGSDSEDGNLFAGEIYNLRLNANLVTLSACQTGLGKISKGEGVIGLSRALVYAGAQNIIVSFWSVADQSTAELMKDFYGQMLQSGPNEFSKNLSQAKLNLVKTENYSAPFYWAPFILIGF